jgi:hypothetical protein
MCLVGDFGVAGGFEFAGHLCGGGVVLCGEIGFGEKKLHLFRFVYGATIDLLMQIHSHFVAVAVEVLC